MITQLSTRYSHKIACFFLLTFYFSMVLPGRLHANEASRFERYSHTGVWSPIRQQGSEFRRANSGYATQISEWIKKDITKNISEKSKSRPTIGGPSQPEMSSFKSVGVDNMVNLFTGDFSYNIPLLDVGGYPINIYYDGGVTMEQEASWVGLGWNINPGNINRNVRGVPDDFNGTDTLKQMQVMKKNKTWGLGVGGDFEVLGRKVGPINAELGVAFNNYLGPSLDLTIRGNPGYKVAGIAGSEKSTASAGLNIGIDINSRSGTSFSGGVSLSASTFLKNSSASFGGTLSTGYNSRSGIKSLQISEQAAFNSGLAKSSIVNSALSTLAGNLGKYSTSISFVKPSYVPAVRMTLSNTAWSGRIQVGLGANGIVGDIEAEVYGQKSEVVDADTLQKKLMVGYLYYQNAVNNPAYVMDFTRFNDREVTPNTPVISIPQYSYDVFSIQGEGTGGSIRAYRNDLGYVRDNVTTSKDQNWSAGFDLGPWGHYGGNLAKIKTPTTIGEWNVGNKLRNAIQFRNADSTYENVYFRNPGETCVIDSNRYSQIGGVDLVRFVLGGRNNSPTIEPKLQSFSSTHLLAPTQLDLTHYKDSIKVRNKRTQVISFLTAQEASVAGLDRMIKNYDSKTIFNNVTDTLIYESIPRVSSYRKAHHISQINVTEGNGKRYVYGIPVYNVSQTDFTFSVDNFSSPQFPDTVPVSNSKYLFATSPLASENSTRDGYVQATTTPAYAHSFLLSGILSTDYVDVTGNGISEDDIGEAVKFNYSLIKNGSDTTHKWRTPLSGGVAANFNPGNRSEIKDDKAIISYGERESWYLGSVESKTMVAVFYTSRRPYDGRGTKGIYGGLNINDSTLRKLDSIALFNKADLRKNGLTNAKSIKTAHFGYSNNLCKRTPDNVGDSSVALDSTKLGKLSLDSIWFTYNGKTRAFNNKYIFSYSSNPRYAFGAADRWGTYKPYAMNPGGLKNSDYPYSIQDTTQKAAIDQNASAWMLNKIVLPSGGQIDVTYESDDYAYVQNKRATDMMSIVGFGSTSTGVSSDRLYPSSGENDYVFVQVPRACNDSADVYKYYLQGNSQLAFRIWVKMPKGPEYITCYATYSNYGVVASNHNIIWIKMNRLAGKSPLSLTALEYLRQQLPGQAFPGYDVPSNEVAFKQIGDMLLGMIVSLRDAFTDPVMAFRKDSKALHTDLSKCFVRLNDPDGIKYGGGYRVSQVTLKDNWNRMTGQYTSIYGKKYNYKTTENLNGTIRTISSGVASYEPSIGGEENPFQTIIQVEDYLPAGPSSFGAVEMPALDAFFPAPVVGYSKVTVTSLKVDSTNKKSRSGVGKQVTEFYTAKDYPVYYNYTPFNDNSVKEFHQSSTSAFLNKSAYDYKAQSQGFLVATNDMHGKMKSQSSYAENDSLTRISYTENFYKNTGTNGLNDKFSFINKDNSGGVYSGNMGIDVELMTDAREFSVKSSSLESQGNVDFFTAVPIPSFMIYHVSGVSENVYRSVTTTKVVSYHSVLDSVVVIDKGSQVSTKNLAYDAQTGEVLVTRTNNEFNQPIYNTSYPAYWGYGGMGLAYKNINATYSRINFSDGKITNSPFDNSVFESGDELLVLNAASYIAGCNSKFNSGTRNLIWAVDKNKNNTSLTTTPDFIFIDSIGQPFTDSLVSFRIIRSGHRNILDAKAETVTSMVNPLLTGKLKFDTSSNTVNASAVEFREKWLVDNDIFRRLRTNVVSCVPTEVPDSLGYLEKKINPYRKGLLGNFRPFRNMVYYDTRKEYDTTVNTNLSKNGFLSNFKLYWDFNASSALMPDSLSSQWVWNSKLNRVNGKGLELETVDALGVYTAAQYGYNRSMPVAIANNARYSEMFAEGFEDYAYGESIDNTTYNFFNPHINFNGVSNTSIFSTDTTTFKAHTGKYVLGINGLSTASLTIPVLGQPDNTSGPNLVYRKDTTGVLSTLGGNYQFTPIVPTNPNGNTGTATHGTSSPSLALDIDPYDTFYNGNSVRMHYYSQSGSFYVNIASNTTYNFTISANTAYNSSAVNINAHSNGFIVNIYDSLGNQVNTYTLSQNGFNYTSANYSVSLCTGVYLVTYTATELYNASNNGLNYTHNSYSWSCSNSSSPDYKNLNKTAGCSFTWPIAATAAMQNPLFSVPANKKMIFTAWVREDCGDPVNGIACKDSVYGNNQVELRYDAGGADTLYPKGPIIDGWQKYEGSFTAPSLATSMTLNLVNAGTAKIYFDDIKIHPFNSNIKSYVYDPVNLRLVAELDANNYATFYDYDEEGTLIRTKVETKEGVKTVRETRSFLQRAVRN